MCQIIVRLFVGKCQLFLYFYFDFVCIHRNINTKWNRRVVITIRDRRSRRKRNRKSTDRRVAIRTTKNIKSRNRNREPPHHIRRRAARNTKRRNPRKSTKEKAPQWVIIKPTLFSFVLFSIIRLFRWRQFVIIDLSF